MLEAEILALPATTMVRLEPACSIVSIAAFHGQQATLATALGVALPSRPEFLTADDVTYSWSGPESWLAIAADTTLYGRLSKLAAGYAAVTDQSAGRVILSVNGPDSRVALAKLVPINLAPAIFPPGATALTLAGHIPVQIWAKAGQFRLACFRSYATSLYQSFVQSSREYES